MPKTETELLTEVADYYTDRLATYGQTARGVDWNGEEGQTLRFEQLTRVVIGQEPFSINDLGCGYGALCDYLSDHHSAFTYRGVDISESMVSAARSRFEGQSNVQIELGHDLSTVADYSVASGIFNVRSDTDNDTWVTYMNSTLANLNESSRLGFAFNCLTSYSDRDKMRDYLFYANPTAVFDQCKREFSRNVALLHDYDLYEFTIIVRKPL